MAMPVAAQQALAKIEQGPTAIVFDPGGASQKELFVRGGVTVNIERGQEITETDLVGTYDIRTSGDGATFELTVPEDSYDVLTILFLDQVLSASGKYAGIGKAAGESLRESALAVRLRPWQAKDAATLQVELWLCVPIGDNVKTQTKEEGWSYTQTFRALPDLTKANGELIGNITAPERA